MPPSEATDIVPRALTAAQKAHAAGWVLYALSIGWRFVAGDRTGQGTLFATGTACFIVGFVLTVYPWLRRLWGSAVAQFFHIVLHANILVVSLIFARNQVAEILRLPPQDFEVAVGTIGLLTYVVTWWFVIVAIANLVGMITLGIGFLPSERDRLSQMWLFGNAIGAFAFAIAAAYALQGGIDNRTLLNPLVEWAAYWGDYHRVDAYPGVPPGARVRLHENGVVSVASVVDGRVVIRVTRMQ